MNRACLAASAVFLAVVCSAGARAEVTLYGKVDLGLVVESGGSSGSVAKLSSGVMSPSRLGVKAAFDVGNGLKAKAQLETGLCSDSVNNPAGQYCTGGNFMGRRATLGLEGGFGELSLGRQFTPAFLNIDNYDPFGTGTAGQSTNLFSYAGPRANNAIVYSTPTLGGFSGSVMLALGEVNGNSKAGRQTGGSLGYAAGPLSIGFAFNDKRSADGSTSSKDSNLGASYDLGVATLHALAQRSTGRDQALVGVSVPVGGGTLMSSVIRLRDRSSAGNDASQFGIGYAYPINKMLKAYGAYAHISNRRAAAYTVGNGTDDGSGPNGLNLGLVLTF